MKSSEFGLESEVKFYYGMFDVLIHGEWLVIENSFVPIF